MNKTIKLTKLDYFAFLSILLLIIYMLSGFMGPMMEDKIFGLLAILTFLLSSIGIRNWKKNKTKENNQ